MTIAELQNTYAVGSVPTPAAAQASSSDFSSSLIAAMGGTTEEQAQQTALEQALGLTSDPLSSSYTTGMTNSALASTLLSGDSLTNMLQSENGIESAILLFCALLMSGMGGEGQSEGTNEIAMALMTAVAGMSSESSGGMYARVMDSKYDYSVLDQVSERVFQRTDGEATPYAAGKPCNPELFSTQSNRSAANYRAIINQFDVENNGRYKVNKKGTGDTYCNIFMWDVTSAMSAEIPHYTDKETGEPRTYPDTKGAMAMTANRMHDWLGKHGQTYGWKEATAEEAQAYANAGRPAVTVWKNSGGHGHVQIVAPSKDGTYNAQKGVAIAQAGRRLRNDAYATDIYGSSTMKQIKYYVHA